MSNVYQARVRERANLGAVNGSNPWPDDVVLCRLVIEGFVVFLVASG